MPDENGLLTEEERKKVKQYIERVWTHWECPFSGHTDWGLGPMVVQTMTYVGSGGLVIGGGQTYPLVVLVCSGCGYTVFVNAIQAGVVEKKETAIPEEAKESGDATG